MHRLIRIALLSFVALAATTGSATAASPAQIHRDATDGSIDGTYTLAEMRAADRSVSAEQREYYGWEDVYSAYLRSLANPDEVAAAVPVDTDKDGKIEADERAAAVKKTKAKCRTASAAARKSKACRAAEVTPIDGEPDEAEPRDDDNEPASDEEEDNDTSPLLWLIVGIPIIVVALGAWRMRRGKSKGDPTP